MSEIECGVSVCPCMFLLWLTSLQATQPSVQRLPPPSLCQVRWVSLDEITLFFLILCLCLCASNAHPGLKFCEKYNRFSSQPKYYHFGFFNLVLFFTRLFIISVSANKRKLKLTPTHMPMHIQSCVKVNATSFNYFFILIFSLAFCVKT